MPETARALQGFWTQFGLAAYPEGCVPQGARLPYITYALVLPQWRRSAGHAVRLFYRDSGFSPVSGVVDRIMAAVGEGRLIDTPQGKLYIRRSGTPVQIQAMDERGIKAAYMHFELSSYQLPA